MKVLHVVSELYPLIKTGGLGDFGFSLPHALKQLGIDVRLLLPGYGAVLRQLKKPRVVGEIDIPGAGKIRRFRVLELLPPGFEVPVWVADCPALFARPGNPYVDADGASWPDNAERFTCFARLAAQLANGASKAGWKADVVHCHDWQTGLVPAFLQQQDTPPHSIFTIHNLAYDGRFPLTEYTAPAVAVCLVACGRRGILRQLLHAQGRTGVCGCNHHGQQDLCDAKYSPRPSVTAWMVCCAITSTS